MEYKLCKDNGMMICCDFDCRKCANLVYEALTDENKILKKEFDKRDKERDGFFNEIKRLAEERDRIHDECKELVDKCQELEEQLEWANEDIESLNNKHWDDGFQIMSKDRKIMELEEKCEKLEKENDYLDQECESLLARFSERIAELEKENNDFRVTNDKLRTMNSELLYRNGLLMKTTAPNNFQKVYIYDELNDKIESLKEDIIRLDKCLSNRQCVQLERIKEERDGE